MPKQKNQEARKFFVTKSWILKQNLENIPGKIGQHKNLLQTIRKPETFWKNLGIKKNWAAQKPLKKMGMLKTLEEKN